MDEQPTSHDFKISEVIIIVLITCTFSVFAGISYGRIKYSQTINISKLSSDESDDSLKEFINQYKYIISNYYDQADIDEEKLLAAALESVVEQINDPYSSYLDADNYETFNINLAGEYEGLGITVAKKTSKDYISIASIVDNSPAAETNLKEDDLIVSIDGKNTKDMDVSTFSDYILKSGDKKFLLKINRDDEEFNINIEKGTVELASVTSEIYNKNNRKVGYLSISIFAANTYAQFKRQLSNLESENIDALIIDLRNNSGGQLTEVGKIISLFLNKDKVMYQLQKNDETIKYYSNGKKDKEYPIVFLANNETASASEVFILSLKENVNAKVVGEKTYGKGTVQELVELKNGDKYKFTTKKWLSPKGFWVNNTKGIEPDVSVKIDDEYLKHPTFENDNQLKEAIKTVTDD